MRVLETINEALRQGGDKSSGGTHTTLIIVLCVVFLLTITIFVFVFARVLVARRAARQAGRGDASGHVASDPARDRLVFAYFPTQAPAVVRMQRLAQTAGLSVQELSEVAPIVPFQKKEGGEEENTCSVCLDEMEAGSKTRRMPCGHDFDAKCIEEWATKANRCPVCNMKIVDEEQLHENRMAAMEGRQASPSTNGQRQRRRRTRGENGAFELHDTDVSIEIQSGDSVEPVTSNAESASDSLPSESRHLVEVL